MLWEQNLQKNAVKPPFIYYSSAVSIVSSYCINVLFNFSCSIFSQMFITKEICLLSPSFSQKYPPVKFLSEKDRKRILVCNNQPSFRCTITFKITTILQPLCQHFYSCPWATQSVPVQGGNLWARKFFRCPLKHLQLFSHNSKGNSWYIQTILEMWLCGWQRWAVCLSVYHFLVQTEKSQHFPNGLA